MARSRPTRAGPATRRIAVQFVLNYEEGGENNVLHGDPTSETFLSELVTAQAYENRHMTMESMYEYGSRVGVWRILREFEQRGLPLTVFGVVSALERYPELLKAFMDAGHEIANHGLRWIHYQNLPESTERRHVGVATHLLKELTGGAWPAGWYTGRDSPNTRRLVADQGGYEYDSDYYGDDLPFWLQVQKTDGTLAPHLVVPYSLDTNDMRFVQAQGFNTGEHFFNYLRDSFDALYAEGDDDAEDDVHRHALPAARPARAHRLAAPLPGPCAVARTRLDLPAHRHRAPLEGHAPVRRADRLRLEMK